MSQFIGLFRAPSIQQARLVALSADREIVETFARQLVEEEPESAPDPWTTRRPTKNKTPEPKRDCSQPV
jgi:hypothetical protein